MDQVRLTGFKLINPLVLSDVAEGKMRKFESG